MPDCSDGGNLLINPLDFSIFYNNVMRLALLKTVSARSLPWLLALVVLAVTGTSLTGYASGRLFLLFPALALVALACVPWLQVPKRSLGLYTLLAVGAFLLAVLAGTLLFHPQLIDMTFCRSFIMLALPFVLLLAALLCPQAFRNSQPLLLALAVFEAVLVAQTFYSYFTGWGEVHDLRNGIRRAFGAAGDSFTLLLSFMALLNFMRGKQLRFTLCMIALFMTGGKLAIGLVLIGLIATFPLLPKGDSAPKRAITAIALSLILALYLTLPSVRLDLTAPHQPAAVVVTREALATPAPKRLDLTAPHPPAAVAVAVAAGPEAPVPAAPAPIPHPAPYTEQSKPGIIVQMITATGLGRLISISAAAQMFWTHPLAGVGYNVSGQPEVFEPATTSDFFSLRDRYHILPQRLAAEKFIGNQLALTAAEQGIIGLAPLLVFVACAALLAYRVWMQALRQRPVGDYDHLAASAAIWLFLMMVLNQTAPWLVSGSVLLIWVALALALCASAQEERA